MKLHFNLVVACLGTLISASEGRAQGTLQWTVRFEGPPAAPTGPYPTPVTNYYEGGVTFTPLPNDRYFGRSAGGFMYPENGTGYLLFTEGNSLTGSTGGRFGLYSVDLAEFSEVFQGPRPVEFIGYRPEGSTVTNTFITDGTIDGPGPLADFQSFYFDSQFSDLVRFEVPSYYYALDNLVFTIVPEPSVNALMLLGGCLLGFRLFKRKK